MARPVRPPAVSDPAALRPGDAPGVGDRLLVLFDADCGFCLSGRDLLRRWDRGRRLADDLIQRHAGGLLSDLDAQTRLATWHVVAPDGTRASGGEAMALVLGALPGAAPAALVARTVPGATGAAYRWMAGHRTGISKALRTNHHPEKGVVPD